MPLVFRVRINPKQTEKIMKSIRILTITALVSEPNNTIRFADVPPTGVTVSRGRTLDGLGTYYREVIEESDAPEADVVRVLKESGADAVYWNRRYEPEAIARDREIKAALPGLIDQANAAVAKVPGLVKDLVVPLDSIAREIANVVRGIRG